MRVNRLKKRKEIKAAKKEIKNVEKMINNLEKSCSGCRSIFDTKNHPEQLDDWHVKVFADHAELFCGSCYSEQLIVESKNEIVT